MNKRQKKKRRKKTEVIIQEMIDKIDIVKKMSEAFCPTDYLYCDFCGKVRISNLHVKVDGKRQCLTCWHNYTYPRDQIEVLDPIESRYEILDLRPL